MHREQDLATRQVVALEQIAHELCAIQNTLETLACHLMGGMTAEEVAEAKAEAKRLKESLRTSRRNLSAAIDAAEKKS